MYVITGVLVLVALLAFALGYARGSQASRDRALSSLRRKGYIDLTGRR